MIFSSSVVLVFLLPAVLLSEAQVVFPPNPCSNIFQYIVRSGAVVGQLLVPNDHSGAYELTVNMSIAESINNNENIKIQLLTSVQDLSTNNFIQYLLIFPRQDTLPKLTEVTMNNRVLCVGPGELLTPGRTVTNMWAKSIIRTTQVSTNFIPPEAVFVNTIPSNPVVSEHPLLPNQHAISQPSAVVTTQALPKPEISTQPRTENRAPTFSGDSESTEPTPLAKRSRCGIARISQNLVFGGEESGNGEFPWLAAIMYTDGNTYRLKCTGSLISNQHVITAGHCLRYYNAPLIENENLVAVLGKNNIKTWPLGITRGIYQVHVHPDYKQDYPISDLVIVVLNKPVEFSATVTPVCLWDENDELDKIVGKKGTVVGWGSTRDVTGFSSVANKVSMPVVTQEQCLRSSRLFQYLTSQKTFCAGNRDGSGPCIGDSGAGLIIQNQTTGRWSLRGIAGYSLTDEKTKSCDLKNYVVFIDVAKEVQWVKNTIAETS